MWFVEREPAPVQLRRISNATELDRRVPARLRPDPARGRARAEFVLPGPQERGARLRRVPHSPPRPRRLRVHGRGDERRPSVAPLAGTPAGENLAMRNDQYGPYRTEHYPHPFHREGSVGAPVRD